LFNNVSGISYDYAVVWNGFRYNGTCANSNTVPDGNWSDDNCARTNCHLVTNGWATFARAADGHVLVNPAILSHIDAGDNGGKAVLYVQTWAACLHAKVQR
jgi:hypothetical protein